MKPKILHLDDDPMILRISTKLLSSIGCEVDARDDLDTDAEIRWSEYGLLLFDWILPKASVVSLCRVARAEGYAGPIVILSSKELSREEYSMLRELNAEYMAKPFGPQDLIGRVRELLADAT